MGEDGPRRPVEASRRLNVLQGNETTLPGSGPAADSSDEPRRRALYGRSRGKTLRQYHARLMREALPQIEVGASDFAEPAALFPFSLREIWLEIGFGGGEHLAARADLLPDHGFIGAEPFLNGVAQALTHIAGDNGLHPPLGNVRIHHGDALEVLQRIPDGTLSFLYLLHPDPWPKARHAKRRMMNDGPLDLFAAKLKPGGLFHFGTDHAVYVRHALMVMRRHTGQFEWLCEQPGEFQNRPGGWPETRYEAKARAVYHHEVWYFRYRRRP